VLTVAFDATPLLGDRTGIGVAVHGMVRELANRPELDLVGYGFTARGWAQLGAALPDGVRPSRGPMPAAALLRVWERFDHPAVQCWTGRVDVVHGTNFVVPPSRRAARLVSVWDLTPVRYPQLCTPTSRRYPALIQRAIEQGAWVHTGSQSVATEIVEHFHIEPARVWVIPPGLKVSPHPALPVSRDRTGAPYLLGLGTVEPRKDFPGLVAAFDQLAETHPDLELWLAGPRGWGESDLERAIAAAAHGDRVRRLGWVDDIGPVLAGASVFVYPSRYEGFGFPPLEAMSAGVPVVATSVGSLPEVLGDAARLVPPGDPAALAAALDQVLTDEALRARLTAAGRRRVTAYSWRAAGDALLRLYGELRGATASAR
jgi:glycosyltransferase involved in cell wall biosynthesis